MKNPVSVMLREALKSTYGLTVENMRCVYGTVTDDKLLEIWVLVTGTSLSEEAWTEWKCLTFNKKVELLKELHAGLRRKKRVSAQIEG